MSIESGKENFYATEQSKDFLESIKKSENEIGLHSDDDKASDDLELTLFKIEELGPELQDAYMTVLEKHSNLVDKKFESRLEFIDATKDLISDLGNLQLNDGRKLKEASFDGGFYEGVVATLEGTKQAGIKIYEELKSTLTTLISPELWSQIANKIWEMLFPPSEFIKEFLSFLKETAIDSYNYITTVIRGSTKAGAAIKLSEYIPEQGIPLIFATVSPTKFFKFFKIDKLVPESVIKATTKDTIKGGFEKGKVNLLEMNYSFDKLIPEDFIIKTGEISQNISKEYFLDLRTADYPFRIFDKMTDYIKTNADKIQNASPSLRQELNVNLGKMRGNLNTLLDEQNLFPQVETRIENTIKNLNDAYYIINPLLKAQGV